MVPRKCGEFDRGARSLAESGRRRRQRLDTARVISWPIEPRAAARPDDESDHDHVVRPLARPSFRTAASTAPAPVGLSWLWQVLGHTPAARMRWSELLRLATASADRAVRASTLNLIGRFACTAGDPTTAQAFFQEALLAGRAGHDAASVACSLSGLAQIAVSRGALDLARTLEEEALTIRRRLGDSAATARSLAVLAWVSLESRGATQAEALHEESLTVRTARGEPLALAFSLVHLGWLSHLLGRREAARRHLDEALATVRDCPDRWKVVALLALLGRPTTATTPTRQAIALLCAAETLEADHETEVAAGAGHALHAMQAHAQLDARTLTVAWAGGRDVDAEDVVEQALRSATTASKADRSASNGHGEAAPLTRRELEVATLISRGHTNRRIAEALVITERTAETHARNIREKLGMTTRAQIAAWAALHGHLDTPGE